LLRRNMGNRTASIIWAGIVLGNGYGQIAAQVPWCALWPKCFRIVAKLPQNLHEGYWR
jgi:hypothetical protein